MSVTAFAISLSISVVFFMLANIYLVTKQYAINKLIRDRGRIVSSYPVIILQNFTNDDNPRPDIVTTEYRIPPPSYAELQAQEQAHTSLPQAPPPYVK